MATDLYQVGATYYSNSTTVDYTGSYQTTSGVPTVTVVDLGPGYPGPVENYVNADGEFSFWYQNPQPSSDYDGNYRYTGGSFSTFDPDAYNRPGGGSVTQPIVVDDGTSTQISYSLDVLIREGMRITGGESFTTSGTARVVTESGTDVSWDNVISLYTGGEPTSIVLASGETSNVLQFSVFDVDIPTGATITGMSVIINRTVVSGSVDEYGTIYRCAFQ